MTIFKRTPPHTKELEDRIQRTGQAETLKAFVSAFAEKAQVSVPAEENTFLWQRNVVDKYKSVSSEDIKKDLEKKALPCAVLAQNLEHDMNIGTIIRSANAFGIFQFYYFGTRHWDRRGAQGTNHYCNVNHIRQIDDVKTLKQKYHFVGLENNTARRSVDIREYIWRPNSLVIIGEEKLGLSTELLDLCDDLVSIPMFGSVRSFNAATAASIAFYDYVSKNIIE